MIGGLKDDVYEVGASDHVTFIEAAGRDRSFRGLFFIVPGRPFSFVGHRIRHPSWPGG